MKKSPIIFPALLALILSACQAPPPAFPPSPTPTTAEAEAQSFQEEASPTPVPTQAACTVYALTYQRPDGNRLIDGRGALPDKRLLEIELSGIPVWLVATPVEGGSLWAAVLVDGTVQAFRVTGATAEPVSITPSQLPPAMPPLLRVEGESAQMVTAPSPQASTLTHPIVLDDKTGRMAFIEINGDLVIWQEEEIARFALNALPDTRLLVDEQQRILLLTGATEQYDHGIMGDQVEASAITLVETTPQPRIVREIAVGDGYVIEGLAPIWADMTGDGEREIIVTRSDPEGGAQLVVFDEQGEQIAAGPTIGQGYRWRHQIAAASFDPEGKPLLVDVLTPHIGGEVEFFQIREGALIQVARVPGLTSHVIHSRNLDMAAAGDFDGDGLLEVLLPDQALENLAAVRPGGTGGEITWMVPLAGRLTTNLAGVMLDDGTMIAGVGRADGSLRLWLPPTE